MRIYALLIFCCTSLNSFHCSSRAVSFLLHPSLKHGYIHVLLTLLKLKRRGWEIIVCSNYFSSFPPFFYLFSPIFFTGSGENCGQDMWHTLSTYASPLWSLYSSGIMCISVLLMWLIFLLAVILKNHAIKPSESYTVMSCLITMLCIIYHSFSTAFTWCS